MTRTGARRLRAALIALAVTGTLGFVWSWGVIYGYFWIARPDLAALILTASLLVSWGLDRLRAGRPPPLDARAAMLGIHAGGLAGFAAWSVAMSRGAPG